MLAQGFQHELPEQGISCVSAAEGRRTDPGERTAKKSPFTDEVKGPVGKRRFPVVAVTSRSVRVKPVTWRLMIW